MAYLKEITRPKCSSSICDRWATVELFNTWNAPIAPYCAKHGKERLWVMKREEGQA